MINICPAFLNESAYAQYVGRPKNSGWNSSTHLAKLNFGHGDEPAYIKLLFLAGCPSLSNEVIGWQLAKACGIPAPSRAAILVADAQFWIDKLGDLPEGCPETGDIAAWCVASCDTIGQHTWVSMDNDQAAIALTKAPRGQQILAFYTWLHNADSNPRNLLRLGNGEWAVIDHEFLFNGVPGDWRRPFYERDYSTSPYLLDRLKGLVESGRVSNRSNAEIRSAMVFYAHDHIGAIARALPFVADALESTESPMHAKSVLPFIVDRAWTFWMPKMVDKLL